MAVLRLLVRLIGITLLATSAACTDSPVQQTALVPTAPTPAISSALMTAPVKGVVREVNAGPLAGATVRLVGTAQPRETQTDQNGHFQLPSVESAPGGSTSVIISHNGFFSKVRRIPVRTPAPLPVAIETALQPELYLAVGETLRMTLTNDDMDLGTSQELVWGLPGERKLIMLRTPPPVPLELRAEWAGPIRLQLWAEVYYLVEHFTATGEGSATVWIPADRTTSPLNTVTVSVGLPRSEGATGGLPAPVDISLTLRARQ